MKEKIDVGYIANLARIKLNDEESECLSRQLGDIISFIEKLNKVNIRDTQPTIHALPLANVFREDRVEDSLSTDEALSNAPEKTPPFFTVPKIIEGP